MRVLLVQPHEANTLLYRYVTFLEPLGLETVAGGLGAHDVRLLDLRIQDNLATTLREFRPDVCGVNCSFTVDVKRALDVVRRIRAERGGDRPYVVVGGHHASQNPTDFGDPAVDAVAIGEGERTFAELVTCLEAGRDPKTVPGLVLNTPEGQISTGRRELVGNLDDLPMPARYLTRKHRSRYYFGIDRPLAMVETARGCPYRCTFCSVWTFYRGCFRAKSASRVVEEVALVEEPHIMFSDDNFLADPERAEQIALELKARGIRHQYACQARSDSIVARPDLIRLWRQVGMVAVFIGVEGIHDDGLAAVHKSNSAANNDLALEILRREGVSVVASFIVDPDWERSDFESLGRYVAAHRIPTSTFSVLTPLPGTVLYRQSRNRLQTTEHEMYDLAHAVTPTRLPIADFYAELAHLYRVAFPVQRVLYDVGRLLWRGVVSRDLSVHHLWRLSGAVRSGPNARRYLASHRSPLPLPAAAPPSRQPSPGGLLQ